MLDAIVIGSGPNGLSAAITLARAGKSVVVHEAQSAIGGGTKSAELTLPGYVHDVCSAVHPMALASPFFRALPLEQHGLEWIHSPVPLAHPLDDGPAVLLHRSLEETADGLGADGPAYRRLFGPLVARWDDLRQDILAPLGWPRNPLAMGMFGLPAMMPASVLARLAFRTLRARALLAGSCGHSIVPFDWLASSAIGLVLGTAGHAGGWPIPRGGSQALANALASYLRSLGGEIVVNSRVDDLRSLPPSRVVIFDLSPRAIAKIAGERLSPGFRSSLQKFRHGPGIFKLDWALSRPIPWKSPECAKAATVHLGGTLEEIERSEKAPWQRTSCAAPYVLLAQPSLFDPTRAPAGRHTAWAYCHVPNGSEEDGTDAIERQVERFAPWFRDLILARSVLSPWQLEQGNANLVGGDIGGGANMLAQLFLRPTRRLYATSDPALFIGSASTPPGGGVHGMCGYHAAQAALRRLARG